MSAEFLLRLRADDTGIHDLANNSITNGNVTYGNPGKFGKRALTFNGSNADLVLTLRDVVSANEDFTVSLWAKKNTATTDISAVLSNVNPYPAAWDIGTFNFCCADVNGAGNPFINLRDSWGGHPNHTIPTVFAHYAFYRKNNVCYLSFNGQVYQVFTYSEQFCTKSIPLYVGYSNRDNTYYGGDMDDICIVKGMALWDAQNFTPPTGYLTLNSVIYLSGQEAWGIDGNGDFARLSNDWSGETDANKVAIFKATGGNVPTVSQLETLTMPIKAINYQYDNTQPTCTVIAVPQPQTITPKGRIPLLKYNKIRQVTITGGTTGGGVVKIAVTKDNSTYQVYDTVNEKWKTIDIADIGNDGMSLTDISALTSAEWIAYDCMDSDIGFAYYLEMASTSDTAYTDELSFNVELMGELVSLVNGIDYSYAYVSNDVLQVKLYKDGDFRINYNPGVSPNES